MAASLHEVFLRELAGASLGAAHLFEPAEYQKGTATREPADLAWVSRESIFLINARRSGETFGLATKHNLKQLRGWLRVWSSDLRLRGSNGELRFDIAPTDVRNIVLLSVVQARGARAVVHPVSDLGPLPLADKVRVIASLPDDVFLTLARLGGTAVDLADLLLQISQHPDGVSAAEAMQLLQEQFDAAAGRAGWHGPAGEHDQYVRSTTTTLRSYPTMSQGAHALADLDWESSLQLIGLASHVVEQVRDVPEGSYGPAGIIAQLTVEPYCFVVTACDMHVMVEHSQAAAEAAQQIKSVRGFTPGVITFLLLGRPVGAISAMLSLSPLPPATQLDKVFEAFAAL